VSWYPVQPRYSTGRVDRDTDPTSSAPRETTTTGAALLDG
jgi:hypothetical protein